MSSPVGNKGAWTRKRPQAQTNPPNNHTKSFVLKRFNSGASLPLPGPTSASPPTPEIPVAPVESAHEPFKVESQDWEAEEDPTKRNYLKFQTSSLPHSKTIKTEDHECQKGPSYSKPIKTEGISDHTMDSQEKGEEPRYIVPLLRSCKKSISPEDAEELNQLKLDQLWQKSVSLTLNAVYCQHAAKDRLDKVFCEMNRLITERNTLQERITQLENLLEFETAQAREEKARTELEKIKVEQEKKRAVEEKLLADSLVAQVKESREKLSEELQDTKAALEEEKSKVSKFTFAISDKEVAAVEAFKRSKDFHNLMFEQFSRGYDDCRAVIQENHPGMDLSWMDVKEEKD